MSRKSADISVSLRLTRHQLASLVSTLEMEVERTVDSEGFCGSEVDERENLSYRCDLQDMLLQLARQHAASQETANAND
jgi:hypothetical protein